MATGSFLGGLAGGLDAGIGIKERRKDREREDQWLEVAKHNAERGVLEHYSPSSGGGGDSYHPYSRDVPTDGGSSGRVVSSRGGGGGSSGGGDRDTFIAEMMPHAQRVSERTGLDPRLVIAQAAQETGWGRSAPGNNYFGIKSHGASGGSTQATHEYVDGKRVNVQASFRGYGGMGDSADGYASFLQENPRYRDMLNARDLDSQLAALGSSGYATDPNYSRSVGSIARSIPMPSAAPSPSASASSQAPETSPRPSARGVLSEGERLTQRFYR